MENILITGITGSGGSYLAEYILENHPEINIFGLCRWHSALSEENIINIKNKIKIYESDLLDLSSIIRALQEIKPTKIFHLAAYANVRKCFDTPLSVINNNIMGTANLLEAIRLVDPEIILHMCSTSEVYGNPTVIPITEDHPLKPVNPYAVSKLTQESLAYSYFKCWNLKIIITRMFAYINPKRIDLFASAFASQIAKIEKGIQNKLFHGNLESIRSLIDVRDAMASYWYASQDCEIGEIYNTGGINIISIKDFLEKLKQHSSIKIDSILDKNLLRPTDITNQVPNLDKFYTTTKWRPKYSLDESIEFLLNYWRKHV